MLYDFLKRTIDIAGSMMALVILLPLMIMVVAGIKLMSEGPIFYTPERVGKGGRLFKMLKFRSMRMYKIKGKTVHAEKYLLKNPKLLALYKKGSFKLADDPRITPFGKIIRKFSLDELPQIINVLVGDMSLVGPRPEQPFFVQQFKRQIPFYMLRHKVKAGLTGWAQVNGWRGDTSLDKRIECDLYYIKNWSHTLDLKIMFMTVWRGFINKNAY